MKITALHNPTAGRGDFDRDALMRCLARHDVTYVCKDWDAWRDPLGDALPADLVVVAGGDGTVSKVARHPDLGNTPFTILPTGTANNVARGLGIEGRPGELVARWDDWSLRPVDLGVVHGPWGEHRFLEAAGFGLLAQAIPLLSALKKDVDLPLREDEIRHDREALGRLLPSYATRRLVLHLDGESAGGGRAVGEGEEEPQVLEGPFLLVEVMNTGHVGPLLPLAPAADPSDGWLDLVLVDEDGREALAELLHKAVDGRLAVEGRLSAGAGQGRPDRSTTEAAREHRAAVEAFTAARAAAAPFRTRRIRRLAVTWHGSELHVDGDVWGGASSTFEKVDRVEREGKETELTFGVLPGAVRVLAPPRE